MQLNTLQQNMTQYNKIQHRKLEYSSCFAGNLEPPEDWPGIQKPYFSILFCHFCHFSNIVKHVMKVMRILVIFTLKDNTF